VDLPLSTELLMMVTFMMTSKGVAGVPRAALVVIAAGCAAFNLPGEAGVAMILAVDELMDMARTSINVMGNCVASVVVARWEGVLGKPLRIHDENSPAAELVEAATP
jgi:Na+/H+-dicarboxylate symporter